MSRVAALDLGTNSTRLLVADVEDGTLRAVERLVRITGLGRGVDESGALAPDATGRVRDVIASYRERIDALGASPALAVATSAVRDAANGREFLADLGRDFGLVTRLLSGEQEALLTLRGVASGRPVGDGTLIVDIGGGSTELVAGGPGGVRFHDSFQIGCVRVTERFLRSDPPTKDELAAAAAFVRETAQARVPEDVRASVREAIGVAGTVTTLATLDLGLADYLPERVRGHRIPLATVERELAHLASLPLAERQRVRGLEPARAPVFVAGVLIVSELLAFFGLDALEASEHDLLDGAALEAASLAA